MTADWRAAKVAVQMVHEESYKQVGREILVEMAAAGLLRLHKELGLPKGAVLAYDGETWTLDGQPWTPPELAVELPMTDEHKHRSCQ